MVKNWIHARSLPTCLGNIHFGPIQELKIEGALAISELAKTPQMTISIVKGAGLGWKPAAGRDLMTLRLPALRAVALALGIHPKAAMRKLELAKAILATSEGRKAK